MKTERELNGLSMTRIILFIRSWSKYPSAVVLVTSLLLASVWALDYVTGPSVNLSIVYFLPIIYAAWAAGRNFAVVAALFSELPTYIDQTMLIRTGAQSMAAGISTITVRLLVYLFAAHVTSRLITRSAELERESAKIISLNGELRRSYWQLEEDLRVAGLLQGECHVICTA